MLCSAGVGNHAVEAALGGNDGVNCSGDAVVVCHITVLELEFSRKPFEKAGKGFCRLGDV